MTYKKISLELSEAQKGLEAMLAEASKDPRPLAFAITDEFGDLLLYAHQTRCPILSQAMAKKKAYTSARMRSPTGGFGNYLKSVEWKATDFGDKDLTGIHGGLPIKDKEGNTIGAVGVSGRQWLEDEAVAQVGLDAITALLP